MEKDESGRLIGMNIDVEPIWKSPYFQYIKQGKEKKRKKRGGKTILTSFSPVPPITEDQNNQVKLVQLVSGAPVYCLIKNAAMLDGLILHVHTFACVL